MPWRLGRVVSLLSIPHRIGSFYFISSTDSYVHHAFFLAVQVPGRAPPAGAAPSCRSPLLDPAVIFAPAWATPCACLLAALPCRATVRRSPSLAGLAPVRRARMRGTPWARTERFAPRPLPCRESAAAPPPTTASTDPGRVKAGRWL